MKHGEGRTVAAVVAAIAILLGAGGALAQQTSSSDVTVANCRAAYEESDAYGECGTAAGYAAATITIETVTNNNRQTNSCRVRVGCPKTRISALGTRTTIENSTSFAGTIETMKTLYNDNGVLRVSGTATESG